MGKYADYTSEAKAAGSSTPNVDALGKLCQDAFKEHISNLENASMMGVRIVSSEYVSGTDVMLMVSPAAYKALCDKLEKDHPSE